MTTSGSTEGARVGDLLDQADAHAALADALAPAELIAAFEQTDGDEAAAETFLENWTIEDLDGATWAARHLAIRLQRIATARQVVADQRARLAEYETRVTKKLTADALFFQGRLQGFHEKVLRDDPRAKTFLLPDGTELRSQAGKLAVEVEDLDAFSLWAEANEVPGVLRMAAVEPNKTEIGKLYGAKAEQETDPGRYPAVIRETGETVPGVVIVRKTRTFTVATPDAKPAKIKAETATDEQ